ncbi:hypothetical protein COS81_00050 [candidate division WWE3 bacterium CG06_land_8_20_14_3_00_42_16]|uniref:protein-glutamate methylesterase n=2 Tax=Katanobacteria TaxID=422282 RepID=A0A2M7APU3_UNCKA|nr:MAG: hypothetical protein COS81_00050 [candidate division WWE3 bacterium CG06_land_8_20_14_3_00_42_16]PIZ42224.1 MAG: hypothetical protein COY34_03215 [candidate division WWE3 bacterium CG_4_10_14_0_2_um_filter_42_8]
MTPSYSILITSSSFFMREIFKSIFADEEKYSVKIIKDIPDKLDGVSNFNACILELDSDSKDQKYELVKKIIQSYQIPVIIITEAGSDREILHLSRNEEELLFFIEKPSVRFGIMDIKGFQSVLLSKIEEILRYVLTRSKKEHLNQQDFTMLHGQICPKKAIVIGSSTGGIAPLRSIIANFPPKSSLVIFVVQHLPPSFIKTFVQRLSLISKLKVKVAEDDDVVTSGLIFVISPMLSFKLKKVSQNGKPPMITISLQSQTREVKTLSIIDKVMDEVSTFFRENTIGIILSGMGNDGLKGAACIRERGGLVIAQDPSSASMYGMPSEVIRAGLANEILSVDKISLYFASKT